MANANSVRFSSAGDVTSGGISVVSVGTPFVVANTNALATSGGIDPHATLVADAVTNVRKVGIGRQCNAIDLFVAWTGDTPPVTPPVVRVYGIFHANNSDETRNAGLTALDPAAWPLIPYFGQLDTSSAARGTKCSYIVPLDDPTADPTTTENGYLLPLSVTPTLKSALTLQGGGAATYSLGQRRSVYTQGCHDFLVHVITAAGAGPSQACILARLSS